MSRTNLMMGVAVHKGRLCRAPLGTSRPAGGTTAQAMEESQPQLFSDGDLTDYLIERQRRFLADVKPATRRIRPDALKARIDKLKARHQLKAPVLAKGLRIVEQGKLADGDASTEFDLVEPTNPDRFVNQQAFLKARVRYLEAFLKHHSSRTYAIIEVSFEGEGALFRYRPARSRLPAPRGVVSGTSIRMKIEQSGRHDHGWHAQLKSNLLRIEALLLHTRREVAAFNEGLSQTLRKAYGATLP